MHEDDTTGDYRFEIPYSMDSPVALNVIERLVTDHPDWRVTMHTTPNGREAMLVEFADEDGAFEEGLPGKFVDIVEGSDGE